MFRDIIGNTAKAVSTATTTVTDKVSGLFAKPDQHHQFIPEFSRFGSAKEMNGIAEILEKLNDKKFFLKKIADEKGVQSDEFSTFRVIEHLMDEVSRIISEFNQSQMKADYYSNVEDLLKLTEQLEKLVQLPDQEKKALNSVAADKPYAKNALVTSSLFAIPGIPLTLLLGPVGAGISLIGGALLSRPANEYLTQQHIISWDTETTALVTSFVDAVTKAKTNLSKYLEDNKPVKDAAPSTAPKPN